MIPARGENETLFQYHKRLIEGKLGDGSLRDEDFAELAEYVYGKPFASDTARRMMYGSKRTLDLMQAEGIASATSEDVLDDIAFRTQELQKEARKFYDQRREYNKLLTSDARAEHLEDRLVAAAEALNQELPLDRKEFPLFIPKETEAVLMLCDWHYGMTTDNIWNQYNVEICKERVATLVDRVEDKLRLHKPEKLHVMLLGDFVHGAIHTTARVAAEELVADQLMHVSELLAEAIAYLADLVPETYVYSTYGNHARTIQNKKESVHADNMERIIPWWLEQRFCDRDDITIVKSDYYEFIRANVCGYNLCAAHGDLDSVKSAGKILYTLFSKKYNEHLDYIYLADKHHLESFEELDVEATVVRSLCGTDEYASGKRLYSNPGQTLAFFTDDGEDARYNITFRNGRC